MSSATSRLYEGWKVVALGFVMQLLSAGPVFYAYSVYGQSFAKAFDAPRTTISLGFTLVLVCSGMLSGTIGALARRWDLRVLAAAGAFSTGVGVMLVGLCTSIWQVVFLFGTLIAFADALLGNVVGNALVVRWFDRRRGLAIGMSVMGASAAAIIYPPLTSWLTEQLGWRAVFFVHGATILLITPLALRWGRPPPAGIPVFELRAPDPEEAAPAAPPPGARALLANRDFWAITVPVGMVLGMNGGVLLALVPFAVGGGTSQTQASLLVSAIGGAALTGKIGFSLIADRANLRHVLRVALFLGLVAFTLLSFTDGYALWLLAATIFGLSLGGMQPVWGAIMAQTFSRNYADAMGWSRSAMTPLSFGCPLLGGVVFDLTGGYEMAWLAYLALTAIALAVSFLREPVSRV